jgi:molybdopterin-containing oxidoreductase family membrane subunit
MKEFLEVTNQFVINDIFIGYGSYSFVFIVITLFVRENDTVVKFDDTANGIVSFFGLVFLISLVILIIQAPQPTTFRAYWWGPWIQSIIWIAVTQLLWITQVRRSSIIRIIISLLLMISFERYVIIVTSFHRDYVPGGWVSALTPMQLIMGLTLKMAIFFLLTYYITSCSE